MPLAKVTDRKARALARIAAQYVGKPGLEALVGAAGEQAQELENALWSLHVDRAIDTAEGAQLDTIGRIVKLSRLGASDADYRPRLKARVRVNLSNGTPEDLIAVFAPIYSGTIRVVPSYPAAFTLRLEGPGVSAPTLFAQLLEEARSGGVRALLDYSPAATADTFALAAIVTFVDWFYSSGQYYLYVWDASAFPASGQVIIDRGTSREEVISYSWRGSWYFALDLPTSYAHDYRATVEPYPTDTSTGKGLGDYYDGSAGGQLAGVVEA